MESQGGEVAVADRSEVGALTAALKGAEAVLVLLRADFRSTRFL